MKVIRKQKIETEDFDWEDEIRFKLSNGEKVKANVVEVESGGMIFITKNCVGKSKPMFKHITLGPLDYVRSDLRTYLNTELLSKFPKKIKDRMLPMYIEGTDEKDLLRIPTEIEIFGENQFGKNEADAVQFYGMTRTRRRITLDNREGFKGYWLQNNCVFDPESFVRVSAIGDLSDEAADEFSGVRLVFLISDLPETEKL